MQYATDSPWCNQTSSRISWSNYWDGPNTNINIYGSEFYWRPTFDGVQYAPVSSEGNQTSSAVSWSNNWNGPITNINIYGSALYWRPTFDGVQYATISPGGGQASRGVYVTPEYNTGYQVGAQLEICCDYFIESAFTSFEQSSSDAITATGQIFPIFSPFVTDQFNSADATIKSRYYAVDIFGGYRWFNHCFFQSHIIAGARYIFIQEKENFEYFDTGGSIPFAPARQRYGVQGWGPRLGIDYLLFPFRRAGIKNLGIEGHLAGSAVLSHRKNSLESLSSGGIFPQGGINFENRSEVIPGIDLSLALTYQIAISCVSLEVTGGYMLDYYFNARKRIDATNTVGFAPRSTSAMGYGGPFFKLGASF